MAMSRVAVLAIFVVALATVIPFAQAQEFATAPAPAPANDGTTVDQGIAYVLMLVALVLTYLIHPMDASAYSFF